MLAVSNDASINICDVVKPSYLHPVYVQTEICGMLNILRNETKVIMREWGATYILSSLLFTMVISHRYQQNYTSKLLLKQQATCNL